MLQYLVIIYLHALNPESHFYRIILMANLVLFILEELLTIRFGGWGFFFSDGWNYLDIAMISCLAFYLSIETPDTDDSKLLAVTNVLSTLRGLTHLRSFESTRIFIYLVV